MSLASLRRSGMQGAALIAVTYVYFLIFAQFAFIHRLDALGIAGPYLKAVMAAMAIGGIVASLVAARITRPSPVRRLQLAFYIAGMAAICSAGPFNVSVALLLALSIGVGLGLLTVTLVSNLRDWTGDRNAIFKVGLGTGVGYFICNIPLLFNATPQAQALVAGLLCVLGVAFATCPLQSAPEPLPAFLTPVDKIAFVFVLASFAALIWLDSAAFFIIQNSPALKANTWQGPAHLWTNGIIHFSAALLSAWLLRIRGLSAVLAIAVTALGFACLLLLDPSRGNTASIFYPAGVSLYSVALVAYPSFLSPAASASLRARQAGWIYAIAGWIGSALGIGMGQNLGRIPPAFVIGAALVVLVPVLLKLFLHRPRELAVAVLVLLIAFAIYRIEPNMPVGASPSAVDRGRQVYISEGCIHCHSQYVRPNTTDVLMWGPEEKLNDIHQQQPPLIGNRRQGPDLAQVGARRSALWLKMHLFNPREVSGSSIMPSYAFLFNDARGNDLVAYLATLHTADSAAHISAEQAWHLPSAATAAANPADGPRLYDQYCATCHNANGRTRLKWQPQFLESPAILKAGALQPGHSSASHASQVDHLAQIIKWGIPNSDMAGHEYMSDRDIASLSVWLAQDTAQPIQKQ